MNLTKQLAMALSDVLQTDAIGPNLHQRGREALNAYHASAEFKRDRFETQLRDALKTANELADTVAELCKASGLSDLDHAHLSSAMQLLAEGADYLNTIIESTLP